MDQDGNLDSVVAVDPPARVPRRWSAKRIAKLASRVCAGPVIYGLSDPGDNSGTLRYVGFTRYPEERLERHAEGKSRNLGMRRWIDGLRVAGLRPAMRILEYTTDHGWAEAERRHIREQRALPTGHMLLNIEDGGPSPRTQKKKPTKADKRKAAKLAKKAAAKARRERNRAYIANLKADPNWLGGPKLAIPSAKPC